MFVIRSFARILTNRLRVVIPNLIERETCGFIHGHTITDDLIVVQEVVYYIYQDSSCFLLKVDIEKDYDMLRWNAIFC